MKLVLASVLALTLGSGALADPLPTGGVTAEEVAAVLETRGYAAEIGVDNLGDPLITTSADGTEFQVVFYNCTDGRCAGIQFYASYDMPTPMQLERINQWNREERFGRGFLDDTGDVHVQMDVELWTGASSELVDANLATWLEVCAHLRDMVAQ